MSITRSPIVRRALVAAIAVSAFAGLSGVADAGEPVRDENHFGRSPGVVRSDGQDGEARLSQH